MTSSENDHPLREALLESLAQSDVDDGGMPEERRRRVARALVDQAVAGNVAAIREIYDRTEGRAAPPGKLKAQARRVVLRWMGDQDPDPRDAD